VRTARGAFPVAAAPFSAWFAWATGQTTVESWQFGELTIGTIPIPKWLPLGGMTLGIALVAVAFLDDLIAAARGRVPAYRAPSEFGQTEG
jgi:TRAP-type C4-dicarboxylate transport system permease small subunit